MPNRVPTHNMSNVFFFSPGYGYLGKRAARIAREHDARLVNYVDPGCACGRGCTDNDCPCNRRHWFEAQDRGEPFNSALQDRVLEALRVANIRVDAHQKARA